MQDNLAGLLDLGRQECSQVSASLLVAKSVGRTLQPGPCLASLGCLSVWHFRVSPFSYRSRRFAGLVV